MQKGLGAYWKIPASSEIAVNAFSPPESSSTFCSFLPGGEATISIPDSAAFASSVRRISPVPPEPVDVWIGGSAEASVDRAARLGDGWLGGPELTLADAAKWAAFYTDRCVAHGRPPVAVALRRDVFVGESDAHADAIADPILAAGYRGFDPGACVIGSPETVAAKFREYAALGYTDIIIRHLTDDQHAVLGSMSRLKEVREAVASD